MTVASIAFLAVSVLFSLVAMVWAAVRAGRLDGAAIFLGFSTAGLMWAVWLVGRAARALTRDLPKEEVAVASGRRRKELEREKQAILKALKELEFDHKMGKISDDDYRDISIRYRARATRILRALDVEGSSADYADLIERDLRNVKQRKGDAAPAPAAKGEDDDKPDEAPVAQRAPEPAPAKSADARPQCPKCQTRNDADAAFCKKCGTALSAAEAGA